MTNHPNRAARFFVAAHSKNFIGRTFDASVRFVCLRDSGSRVLSGTMFATKEAAEADAAREAGPFDGTLVGVEALREISRAEAEELGAALSSDPALYRTAFHRG